MPQPDVSDSEMADVLFFAWISQQQPTLPKPGMNPPPRNLEPLDEKLRDEQDKLELIAHDEALGSWQFDEDRDDGLADGRLRDENGKSSTVHVSFGVFQLMGPDFDLDI